LCTDRTADNEFDISYDELKTNPPGVVLLRSSDEAVPVKGKNKIMDTLCLQYTIVDPRDVKNTSATLLSNGRGIQVTDPTFPTHKKEDKLIDGVYKRAGKNHDKTKVAHSVAATAVGSGANEYKVMNYMFPDDVTGDPRYFNSALYQDGRPTKLDKKVNFVRFPMNAGKKNKDGKEEPADPKKMIVVTEVWWTVGIEGTLRATKKDEVADEDEDECTKAFEECCLEDMETGS